MKTVWNNYENIRRALEMGPTPGEWYWSDAYRTPDGRKTWSLIGDGGFGILSCDGEENSPQSVNTAAAELIAACDPDTIRALLAERDALLDQHHRDSKELRRLCAQRDAARKVSKEAGAVVAELRAELDALREALTELCDEIDRHEIHATISKTNISWFKRKARAALGQEQGD